MFKNYSKILQNFIKSQFFFWNCSKMFKKLFTRELLSHLTSWRVWGTIPLGDWEALASVLDKAVLNWSKNQVRINWSDLDSKWGTNFEYGVIIEHLERVVEFTITLKNINFSQFLFLRCPVFSQGCLILDK